MLQKVIAKNKKAYFDYEVKETLEAGLVLTGPEVKSAKKGQMSLKGAFVSFHNNKAGLSSTHISRYKPAGKLLDYDPERWRELLLHKKQIAYLQGKFSQKGLTILPLSVYTSGRLVKAQIGVCRGKKLYDKRQDLKKKAIDKEIKQGVFWPRQ